jgi:hypothetical protein
MRNHIPKTATNGYKQIVLPGKKMNTVRFPFLKATFGLTLIFSVFLALTARLPASGEDHIDDGLAVAKAWTNMIDSGQYDDSYSSASDALHERVDQDKWNKVLSALRAPWGSVVSRKQLSHIYKPNGFEGSEGEFMVITYDTSFQHLDPAVETIVLKWEGGKWRGAGYNAGPKPTPGETTATGVPDATTETQTQDNVKPMPQ